MQSFRLDPSGQQMLDLADKIAIDITRANASDVDERARFPRETLDAMSEAGLLGLVSATEIGGLGQGLRAAAAVCERLARECPSTAMITKIHYCATAVIEAHGGTEVRKEIAAGKKIATLAFSEFGSRSHFWVPVSSAE